MGKSRNHNHEDIRYLDGDDIGEISKRYAVQGEFRGVSANVQTRPAKEFKGFSLLNIEDALESFNARLKRSQESADFEPVHL